MATRFSHSVQLGGPLEAVHASYADEAYWADRLRAVGTAGDTLDDLAVSGDTITVTVTQHIPESDIPDLARKVLPGELSLVRTTQFSGFDGARLVGTSRAEAAGGLGVITGSGETVAEGDSALESLSGQVKVTVPLLGGKLEKLVVQHLDRLFAEEYAHLNGWLAAR
ncbi:DUF2505 domain-containing protein [Dietzia aurantiaca]|uniref:DUF2505 domain-containing protein n=1 Tax=Dietzia aurantiaca TaxID=983873 RepID=A0ABV9PPK1_9ACTN